MLHRAQWGITARHVKSLDLGASCPSSLTFPHSDLSPSPSHTLAPYLPGSMAALKLAPAWFRCHFFRGPSPCSCRHRIKACKITLLCPYGDSIGLAQWTLNCNSAIVEIVSWATQSAHIDKLLALVIFQMWLSPRHIWTDEGHNLQSRHMTLICSFQSVHEHSYGLKGTEGRHIQ